MQEDVTVTNIMADGTICEDLSTYLKSADQLPELTKILIARFIQRGRELEAKKAASAQESIQEA